jgi:hypothetical protein
LKSVGLTCAVCHATVNDALAPGIGVRLDGWANRDLNVGAIAAVAPNLQPVADLLGTDVETVKKVLDFIGNNFSHHSFRRRRLRCRTRKLCKPQPSSIARSEKFCLVLRSVSLSTRTRLAPPILCSTRTRMRDK